MKLADLPLEEAPAAEDILSNLQSINEATARILSTSPSVDIVIEVSPESGTQRSGTPSPLPTSGIAQQPLYVCEEAICFQREVVNEKSPEDALNKFDENVALNPSQWNKIEKEMVRAAEEAQIEEEMKCLRALQNEEYRLLDEIIYPLTKSGSKFVAVGVLPLKEFTPVLRISNPQLTAAILFELPDFKEFLAKDTPVGELKNYHILVSPYQVVQFRPKNITDVYKPLYLVLDTVRTVLDLGEHLLNLMETRRIKNKCYPNYERFILNVALHIMEHGSNRDMEKLWFNMIRDHHESDQTLYELCLKLPLTMKKKVDAKISYFMEHNDFNCI
ncbi:hypothetical protein BDFB_006524 [Asbolus verrucosus]|uniref:Uncharacterized protein n=1 Tax=Asbolus verrucosus TaxID=1661398 RepID=A0A482W9V8_ASBVE|nr:hypothetical protein BDFB_006524 [Asbolus verrucosus]